MAGPQSHGALAYVFLLLLLLFPAATATSYSSLCTSPSPAPDLPPGHRSRITRNTLLQITAGHFSSGGDLHFAPDLSHIPRSFSFYSRRYAATTDPAVVHLFATLTLEGTRWRRDPRPHSVSFDLEGYYSTANATTAELCMVGSGSYAREDGFGVVLLSDIALRLHVPHPPSLSRPFVTGRLEGTDFRPVTLVAYAGGDYAYGDAASCPAPPAPVRGVPHVLDRLRPLIRGTYSLKYGPGGHPATEFPLQLRHRHMYFNQMRFAANGALRVRAYMVFANQSDAFPSNYTVRPRRGFLVGEEALVADGFWNPYRRQLCLKACLVVRSGPSRSDLAVRECGIGVSFWFPAVWSIRDRSNVAGMIWNTSIKSDGDAERMSAVISVSRTGSYMGNFSSEIKYNYTRVEEAKMHYHSKSALSKQRNGTFPGSYSYRDLAFGFYLKKHGSYGYASLVTIGSAFVQGYRLMTYDTSARNGAAEMKNPRLLNVSYDLQYHVPYVNSSAHISQRMMSGQQRISAEGVYDTKTGSLCMVACQGISNGSLDCEVLVIVQFAPVDAETRERAVGTISSLRKQSDSLFFEALDLVADGMYVVQMSESRARMDMEGIMLVASMTLSCVFTALQLRHVRKNPEALPATSITMLVVLALGYAVPLVLNLEAVLADKDSRDKHFVQLTSGGLLELNEFMLRVSTMLAFVLQLRLLQLAVSQRRPAEAGGKHEDSSSDAERSTLWICLPLYLLGAILVWIVHMSDGDRGRWNQPRRPTLVDDLAAYAGLILDGFLLPQVVWNAFADSKAPALSPWFYGGGTLIRSAPHVYDAFRRQNYVPSWTPSYVYASPREALFGVAWDVAVPCGAALLATLLFLQQRLGGAFLCCVRSRRPGEYEMVSTLGT